MQVREMWREGESSKLFTPQGASNPLNAPVAARFAPTDVAGWKLPQNSRPMGGRVGHNMAHSRAMSHKSYQRPREDFGVE